MSENGTFFSSLGFRPYLLKYIQAVSANKTIVTTQSDELLISVFLAMNRILSPTLRLCEVLESWVVLLW